MKKYKNPDLAILILRIFLGVVFVFHGFLKLQNVEGARGFFEIVGLAPWLAIFVGIVEILAGLSMILGYGTMFAAIAIAVIMIFAIIKVKYPMGGLVAGELEASLILAALTIYLTGPGKYSLGNKCGCVGGCVCGKNKCNIKDSCMGDACKIDGCNCDCHR